VQVSERCSLVVVTRRQKGAYGVTKFALQRSNRNLLAGDVQHRGIRRARGDRLLGKRQEAFDGQ
jgi:hypothetical protein